MTNTKLDFEAAKDWAEEQVKDSQQDNIYVDEGWVNAAACYLALLQKTETLKAALSVIATWERWCGKVDCTCRQDIAAKALAEFEEIKP